MDEAHRRLVRARHEIEGRVIARLRSHDVAVVVQTDHVERTQAEGLAKFLGVVNVRDVVRSLPGTEVQHQRQCLMPPRFIIEEENLHDPVPTLGPWSESTRFQYFPSET